MAKANPYLKKATGAAKAPSSLPAKKHGLGRKVDFGTSGVNGLLGTIPSAAASPTTAFWAISTRCFRLWA